LVRRSHLVAFVNWLAEFRQQAKPSELTAEDITKWKLHLAQRRSRVSGLPLRPCTIYEMHRAARRFCFWLAREGLLPQSVAHSYSKWMRLAQTIPVLSGVTAYSFRRACATELVRSGADLCAVQEQLGHEDVRNLLHYVRTDLTDLKKAHAKYHPRDQEMDDDTRLT
jgi:integrase